MRKLAIFSAAFALAAAIFVYLLSDARVIWIAGACLALSVLGRLLGLKRVAIAGLGISVGFLWSLCYQQIWLKDAILLDERDEIVTVRVSQLPYETNYGAAAHCRMDRYEAILYGDDSLLSVQPGDTVLCRVQIETQNDSLYLRSDGIILCLYADGELSITEGSPNVPEYIRLWLQSRIDMLYEGEAAGLVKALLTGDRSGLSYETTNELSVVGLSHAVAVSGMHVSILLTMVAMLCGYQPRLMALLGIPVTILFALMTGASPSVCRAAVMQILLLAAPLVRRERDNATTLGAAALILLVQNPWCIASVSFQLSFAAVAGLMLFSGRMQRRILRLKKKPGKVLRFIASGVSATLGATLPTLPLTIFYFGMVSVVAPLTNLLSLWAVTGVFTFGLSSCLIGPVVAWVAAMLSEYVLALSGFMASFPYAAAYLQNIPLMIWAVMLYFLLAAFLLFDRMPVRWIMCCMTAGFLACIVSAHLQFSLQPWRLTVLDVGQGQCLVLQIGSYTAIIDCGGSDPQEAGEEAARFLHSAGMTHADALILTHYDEDHAGGAVQFLRRVHTDAVYLPVTEDAQQIAKSIEETAEEIHYVTSVVEIELPNGKLTLFPPISQENDNNGGVCVLATAEEYDILITGDLDAGAESLLIANWDLPDVELLLAGHHGARTSTSGALLLTVRPETVAISVGADNSYGHPHEETLARIRQIGAEIYRTDQMGNLYFVP